MIKKRIALITTYFPPVESVATNRMISFVEYLSETFEVTVFCLGNENTVATAIGGSEVIYSAQNKLVDKIKHKTSDNKAVHLFKTVGNILVSKLIKDPLKSWSKITTKKLLNQHKTKAFDCIISSYAPSSAHEVALNFKSEYNNVHWIADMRDEMSMNPGIDENQRENFKRLEKRINQNAQAILAVSAPIVDDFKNLCPNVPVHLEVRNGFNHNYSSSPNKAKSKVFQIGYFGKFYGEIKPHLFFKALVELLFEDNQIDFQIQLVGVHRNFNIPQELLDKVSIHASLPYNEAIEKMGEMDLNLLLLPKTVRRGVYSGKIFDYLSVQRPILAAVDKTDVAAQLIDEMDAGYIAEFDSVKEIKEEFKLAYSDWQTDTLKVAKADQVATLHRKYQVEKVKSLIENNLVK